MKIVANSLPKSGTHVLTKILDILELSEAENHFSASMLRPDLYSPLQSLMKLARVCLFNRDSNAVSVDLDLNDKSLRKNWFIHEIGSIQDGFYVQGHLPYSKEVADILFGQSFQIIHIVRDPRDVFVSYVNHICRDPSYPYHKKLNSLRTMEEKLLLTMKGMNECFQPLNFENRLNSTIGWLTDDRVCLVRFEEIIGTQGGGQDALQEEVVKRILVYLGVTIDDSLVMTICDNLFDKDSHTFHKGRIGSWRRNFTQKAMDDFDEKYGEISMLLGYE